MRVPEGDHPALLRRVVGGVRTVDLDHAAPLPPAAAARGPVASGGEAVAQKNRFLTVAQRPQLSEQQLRQPRGRAW